MKNDFYTLHVSQENVSISIKISLNTADSCNRQILKASIFVPTKIQLQFCPGISDEKIYVTCLCMQYNLKADFNELTAPRGS